MRARQLVGLRPDTSVCSGHAQLFHLSLEHGVRLHALVVPLVADPIVAARVADHEETSFNRSLPAGIAFIQSHLEILYEDGALRKGPRPFARERDLTFGREHRP